MTNAKQLIEFLNSKGLAICYLHQDMHHLDCEWREVDEEPLLKALSEFKQ